MIFSVIANREPRFATGSLEILRKPITWLTQRSPVKAMLVQAICHGSLAASPSSSGPTPRATHRQATIATISH